MRFLLPLLLLSSSALAALQLEGTTDALELVTVGASVSVDYQCSWSDVTATALTTPGTTKGNVASATTTTVIAAPAASHWRYVRACTFYNANTIAVRIGLQVDVSATNRELYHATLQPEEWATITSADGWEVFDTLGRQKLGQTDPPGFSGRAYSFAKAATAIDTIGYHYLSMKDTGFPGAMALGTPGVNGTTLDCSTAAGAAVPGAPVVANPASGSLYLTRFGLSAVVPNTYGLVDLLWYNTGLTVTTTTNQAITSGAMPARDTAGGTNGEGLRIALYALTTVANAAAVSNTTVSYTNSQGTAGRTATFAAAVGFQAPTTSVIGTFIPFQLQAGDTGVKTIEGITLGTSYVSGTLSLLVFRDLASEGVNTANFPSGSLLMRQAINPGVRLYNGTCLGIAVYGGIAVTAPSFVNAIAEVMER